MADTFSLQHNTETVVDLSFDYLRGEGKVAPRLVLGLSARPRAPYGQVELHRLKAEMRWDNELLGVASLRQVVQYVPSFGTTMALDMPVTPGLLPYADEHLRDAQVTLMLEFRGYLRAHSASVSSPDRETTGRDGWVDRDVHSGQGYVRVPRSDWIAAVVEPLGVDRYVLLEVPIPPAPERENWRQALDHAAHAERLFREGNDAEVLARCHAAFESLAGAPERVVEGVSDPKKRERLNNALRDITLYMHAGRHVSPSADGEFDVDHRDAAFALGQTKLWLSYIARLRDGRT